VLDWDSSPQKLRARLKKQYERWWSIDIDQFESKEHFLRYAGRYVRRPPIAQYRFTKITDREIQFWTKDKILKRRKNVSCTPEEFVATFGGTRSRPLPTRDSLLRATGASRKSPDLDGCICAVGTTDALSSATSELGIFTAKGFWSRSPY
jgi:hypothetical protein